MKKQEIISAKAIFESLDPHSPVQFDEITEWEQKIMTKLVPVKDILLETIPKWDTLTSEMEYINLIIEIRQCLEFMKNILGQLGQPFLNPRAILTNNQIPIEGHSKVQIQSFARRTNEIYVKYLSTETNFLNTTNIINQFRNWLANRSILKLTIFEAVLSVFCMFSFFVNIIDIILKFMINKKMAK